MTSESVRAKRELIFSMTLFGTIGLFVRGIGLPSSAIAMIRGLLGAAFLLIYTRLRGEKLSREAMGRNALLLAASGAAIGVNWILLFEAYRYTTVATATVCYYLAPVFLILTSPLTLGEKLTRKKTLCVLLALVGTVFISGGAEGASLLGVVCGVGAAAFYATVMTLNKKFRDISAYERTVVQLAVAGIVVAPYVFLMEDPAQWSVGAWQLVLLLIVGFMHTGYTYALFFGAVSRLETQTVAIYSYLDPLVAVLLSALVLREPMGLGGIVGAVLVLGSTLWSELGGEK